MPLEIPTNQNPPFFQVSWKMVFLICRIERFDELWPSLSRKAHGVVSKWIIPEKQNIYDLSEEFIGCPDSLSNFNELIFWYETETKILPLIKCLIFAWYLQFIPRCKECGKQLGIEKGVELLIENGYTWACYIPCDDLQNIGYGQNMQICEWILSVLEILDDGQNYIMGKIDSYRSAWKLIASKELLLYIIEHNPKIRTTAIAKKLGASISTAKKMLRELIENRMIERNGNGRGTHYRLL